MSWARASAAAQTRDGCAPAGVASGRYRGSGYGTGRTALGYRGHTICFAAKSHDLFCSKNMSHTESECLSGSYFL